MKRERAEWLACMLVASVGLVYALWVVPYIPTTDGPQHVLSAHIENHFADPGSNYPEFYRVLPQFAGKGFALLFGPLESILPWRVALRVALSVIALAFAWGFALVVLSLEDAGARRPTAMLGFLIALPWSLYMGFFPFVVGTTVGLYTLAFVLRRPPTTTARQVVLSLLLVVQGVCHIFTAVLTGPLVLVLAVVAAPKTRHLRQLARMIVVGTPAALLLGITFRGQGLGIGERHGLRWSLGERFGEISRWCVPGPGLRAWLVVALAIAAIAATLARTRRGKSTPTENAVAWLATGFLLLTIFSPLHIPGWRFFGPRFAVLGMVLGLALVRLPGLPSPRTTRAAVAGVAACCVGSELLSASLHRQLATGCADALAGLDAPLRFEGPRLPMIFDPSCATPRDSEDGPIPGASLAFNTPLLYLVEHGGIGTKMFQGTASIHAIEFVGRARPPPPSVRAIEIAQSEWFDKDQKLRTAALIDLAADGMPFEGVHVYGGRPDDFAIFREHGYVTEFERGRLFIGRFEGCPAQLLLEPGALDRQPVYYEYGLFSAVQLDAEPRSFGARVVDPATPVVDGAIRVPLGARPCGEIWVRAFRDADGSSTFTPSDQTCANARWQGRVRANVSRDHATVRCALPP